MSRSAQVARRGTRRWSYAQLWLWLRLLFRLRRRKRSAALAGETEATLVDCGLAPDAQFAARAAERGAPGRTRFES